jgi:hypothetical protein
MLFMRNCLACVGLLLTTLHGRPDLPENTRAAIDHILGQKGEYVPDEGVYRFVIPREAALIVRDWETMSPNLGLNSWFAFASSIREEAIVTGEILLLPDEVDPVVSRLLDADLEITGLSESSSFPGRRIYTLNLKGRGTFNQLASAIRTGMAQIRSTRQEGVSGYQKFSEPTLPECSSIDPDPINATLPMHGTVSGGVYAAAIGRNALLGGKQMGRELGMSTWISISGTNRQALARGEIVATSEELQNVLRALRSEGASVVSIRNHTVGEQPEMLFVGYRAIGPAVDLAQMLRFVLGVQNGAAELKSAR